MGKGVDNCHQSWQGELTAMELFAEAGADQTLFSTNGSTENVHGAMMTVVTPSSWPTGLNPGYGPHRYESAFSGLVLSGARPVYVGRVSTIGGR